MSRFEYNSKLNSQGSVVLSLFLTVIVLVSIAFIYYYYTRLTVLGPPPIPILSSTPTPADGTINWKSYEDLNLGITLKIPTDWYISEDNKYISQFPFDPKRFSANDVYNSIYIFKTTAQLQSGYTNSDWLNQIDNLKPDQTLSNEFRPATNLQLAKIASGTTADGHKYVVFKNTALDEGVTVAFLKDTTVYILVLQHYNQTGIDTFQKIVNTVRITTPQASP